MWVLEKLFEKHSEFLVQKKSKNVCTCIGVFLHKHAQCYSTLSATHFSLALSLVLCRANNNRVQIFFVVLPAFLFCGCCLCAAMLRMMLILPLFTWMQSTRDFKWMENGTWIFISSTCTPKVNFLGAKPSGDLWKNERVKKTGNHQLGYYFTVSLTSW